MPARRQHNNDLVAREEAVEEAIGQEVVRELRAAGVPNPPKPGPDERFIRRLASNPAALIAAEHHHRLTPQSRGKAATGRSTAP
jgi:hypothetical protein